MGRVYNPKANTLIIGPHIIGGLAEDGIEVSLQDDDWLVDAGMDGEIILSLNPTNIAAVTIRCLMNSSSNAILSAVRSAAKEAGTLVPFLLRSGTTIIASGQFVISKAPDVKQHKRAQVREWKGIALNCAPYFVGSV